MHAHSHRRKDQLPLRSLRDLRSRGRNVSSPAIWATEISAQLGDQMSRRLNGQTCSHNPKCRSEAKRSDVPYVHASMLLLSEGSEATEPYNKYANIFKHISYLINLINPFGRHFCRPCNRRHIVGQMAGDEMSLTPVHQLHQRSVDT